MTISFGNDHAGYPMRSTGLSILSELGHEVIDNGSDSRNPVDFPDIVRLVCEDVLAGRAERGLLVCGTGLGACMAANKFKGIRAGVVHDCHCAHQGVEHDDMNVMCIGAQIVGPWLARDIIMTFLQATFEGTPDLVRRVAKMAKIESERL